ncbi:protein kinase domain-containing protein [Thalassobacillus hwangdonensis]|uniref:Protein kinase n=1 Tax=Thalassobacillus hwangdonensis TaxID=546108 RepID=A0ABW3L984_9BACI
MQMNHTKKQAINLQPGTLITGKWTKKSYRVLNKLGEGACGVVYLCEYESKRVALKISQDSSRITTEVNVLKTFQKVQGKRLGPSLMGVDDWIRPNGTRLHFYVMEYIKGYTLSTFLRGKGKEWVGILILQMLTDLHDLHQAGWVFGDLKTDNLLVSYPPARIRWIDVGGTTQNGRAIKEYTEFYDRGYWQMGSRKAEPSYDLFAVTMIMLEIGRSGRFERGTKPQQTLLKQLSLSPILKPYEKTIRNVWEGSIQSSAAMKNEISVVLTARQNDTPQQPTRRARQRSSGDQKQAGGHAAMEMGFISVVVCFFYFIYIWIGM